MSAAWSYALGAVGVFGLWLAGRKNSLGWAVGLSAQALWLAYALATRQWGSIFTAVAYGWVYARNWRAWRRDARFEAEHEQQTTLPSVRRPAPEDEGRTPVSFGEHPCPVSGLDPCPWHSDGGKHPDAAT